MEEGVGDVKLANRPPFPCSNGEHRTDGRRLHNGSEGLTEVDAGALRETAHNPAGLVAVEAPVGVVLMLEHPLAGDDIRTRRSWDKPPCVVRLQGVELTLHGRLPVGVA